ncbi:MAG: polysaccharide deacetylase family protein [Bacteroidales bacterium]|nr:polysaccharide deacetylase family protein [Candidatus Sodaliphilus aphodohippi]
MNRFVITLTALVCILPVEGQTLAKYRGNARAAVSYTFDDGLAEHYTMVMPHLDSLGIKGTFWIIGDNIDTRKPMVDHAPMTWSQVATMSKHGHEIGNHGFTHSKGFNELTNEQIDSEIWQNDSAIFANTGIHPVSLAYPGNGRNDAVVAHILSSGNHIVGTRTSEHWAGGGATTANLDQWLQSIIESGEWGVTMTHGITHGYDRFDNPEALWHHLKHACKLASSGQLWIATFAEVTAYRKGITTDATYILPEKPKKITQGHKRLNPYQSWDGSWCVDALRNIPLDITY